MTFAIVGYSGSGMSDLFVCFRSSSSVPSEDAVSMFSGIVSGFAGGGMEGGGVSGLSLSSS